MCKGCMWNWGIKRVYNRYGYKETRRNCGFYGLLDHFLPLTTRKNAHCPGKRLKTEVQE